MRKVILYLAMSIDGFIASADGSVDWISTDPNIDLGEFGFDNFLDQIDAILMGSNSYRQNLTFGDWCFGKHTTYVFSSKVFEVKTKNTKVVNTDHAEFVKGLKEANGKDIWCFGGGALNHFLLENNLIDEFLIFVQPTVVGNGISLFGNKEVSFKTLHRKETTALGGGFSLLRYSK